MNVAEKEACQAGIQRHLRFRRNGTLVRLSAEGEQQIIFTGPPSQIIQELPGEHTEAEKRARVRLILEQRALLVEEAGHARMLAQLANSQELTGRFAYERKREREALLLRHRREQVEVRGSAAREHALAELRRAPNPPIIRIVQKEGRRVARENLLTEDDLYLTDARPTWIAFPSLHQTCSLCLGLKSHPVVHCFVCIRLSLESSWGCPECAKKIFRRPVPHDEEEVRIERDNAGWDKSKVTYSWAGLSFPRPHYSEDSE
ncbi:hypothetical protein B0H19DRAFT_1271044 [Mycena capillaripes]|nr:hypothetical protein B0H19DRAFT_1271044 [Mycena capillaripes]